MTTDPATTDSAIDGSSDSTDDPRSRLTALWVLIVVLVVALVIDQVSKELALHALVSGPRTIAGVRLQLVANRGILMGIPAPTGLIVLATIAVVFTAVRSARGSRWSMTLAYGLLAGGALGNLVDRFQDRHFFPSEAVVDWISAGRITFNLADVFLIAGVVLLFLLPIAGQPPRVRKPLPDIL